MLIRFSASYPLKMNRPCSYDFLWFIRAIRLFALFAFRKF